jgi:hypothetical protein
MRIAGMLSYSIGALLAIGFSTPAQAQGASDYPNRPIRVIVSNSAGSSVDITARIIAEAVKKYLGQGLVTENKPGGGQRFDPARDFRPLAAGDSSFGCQDKVKWTGPFNSEVQRRGF